MSIQRLPIHEFMQRSVGHIVLDVRSPAEYNHACMPGAISVPLFSDEERKQIGTAYKQQSRELAIKIGLGFFGPRMKEMVEKVENIVGTNKPNATNNEEVNSINGSGCLIIYCWRGGMRSGAVAWLLDLYGFKVHTLAGGYKAFRNYVLKSFDQAFNFKIVGGYTGSGKTEVLNRLGKNGESFIDLEAIASHKGSAFGSHKMPPQPSQEMFENLLSTRLNDVYNSHPFSPIWLEDESQRIGNINIPNAIWEKMRSSPVFFLDIPFEQRLDHLVEEYQDCDKQKLIESTLRISKRLGPLETRNTVTHLENGEFTEAFRYLLLYYDKLYLKGLHNRERLLTLLTNIPSKSVDPENARLLTKYQTA